MSHIVEALRSALMVMVEGGSTATPRDTTRRWVDHTIAGISTDGKTDAELLEIARRLLADAPQLLPMSSARRYRAIVEAQRIFEERLATPSPECLNGGRP